MRRPLELVARARPLLPILRAPSQWDPFPLSAAAVSETLDRRAVERASFERAVRTAAGRGYWFGGVGWLVSSPTRPYRLMIAGLCVKSLNCIHTRF